MRLQSFDSFVKGELVQGVQQATWALQAALNELWQGPDELTLRAQLAAAGIDDVPTIDAWLGLHQIFRERRRLAIAPESRSTPRPALPSSEAVDAILNTHQRRLLTAVAPLASDGNDAESDPTQRVDELEARRWLTDQRAPIEAELVRLQRVALLEKARRSAATAVLSRKKGDLADELVSQAFQERFQQELVKLKAQRVRVKLERTRVDRGRALHQMKVDAKNVLPPLEVLSEGERRIISLAAFLADAAGTPASTPFIFDDPISSLDQEFEEAVVERLIELAGERQVIVFTHRLSLLVLLQDAADRSDRTYEALCVRAEPWGIGEPSDVSLDGKTPIKALNKLHDERPAKARKTYRDQGSEDYAPLAKAICSDFRILLERIVEYDLLANVVQRFRRSVVTKDKIRRLALIRDEDVTLIDSMMTKYSIQEHSQPRESPVPPLLPDELQSDITRIIEWHGEFSKRSLPAAHARSSERETSIPPASGEVTRVISRVPQRGVPGSGEGAPNG